MGGNFNSSDDSGLHFSSGQSVVIFQSPVNSSSGGFSLSVDVAKRRSCPVVIIVVAVFAVWKSGALGPIVCNLVGRH